MQNNRQDIFIYRKVSKLIINIAMPKYNMLNHSNSNIHLIQLEWCRIAPMDVDG